MPNQIFNLNTSNYVSGNRYRLTLKDNIFFDPNSNPILSVNYFSMYNSFYNISALLANNTFSIKWINGLTYSFVIDDGYYGSNDLSLYIFGKMMESNLYLYNTNTSKDVQLIEILEDSIGYKTQINIYSVPSASDCITLGLTKPNAATWNIPTVASIPSITFNPNLASYFGFKQTDLTFPNVNSTGDFTIKSNTYPKVSKSFTIQVCCNLVSNSNSNVPDMLYQQDINNSYGQLIKMTNTIQSKVPIGKNTHYKYIDITLFDQDFTPLQFIDPEISLTLNIDY